MIECYDRTAYQYTWWEMYPTNDVQIVGETAAAGDAITASVVRSGTSYKLTVTDATHTADSFTKTETCSASSCVDSSAEWIAEAPTGSSGVEPLADFGTWTASGAAVTEGTTAGTISSFTDDEITMVGQLRQDQGAARPVEQRRKRILRHLGGGLLTTPGRRGRDLSPNEMPGDDAWHFALPQAEGGRHDSLAMRYDRMGTTVLGALQRATSRTALKTTGAVCGDAGVLHPGGTTAIAASGSRVPPEETRVARTASGRRSYRKVSRHSRIRRATPGL